jgi:FKBP-type peptidyl-prolyl cis-trans isomerase (trigger factor)
VSFKIQKIKGSEVEIEGEIPFSEIEKYREKAVRNLSSNIVVDGFRKGHVPEKIAMEKIGEMNLLNEMAEMALSDIYPKIIIDNKIDPIERPRISINKIGMGSPLGFKIIVTVMPDVNLPDYKKIASDINSKKEIIIVTEEDINNLVDQVLESKRDKDNKDWKKPELTDDFVKTLGEFKSLEDFNKKVEEGIKKEKEWRQKEKIRLQIMEEIISQSDIELPELIIESELNKMVSQFKGDVSRMGLKPEEYLQNIGKNEDSLRKEWRGEAEKRGKNQLILNKIAVVEKIYPKAQDVEKETEHILSHHKDADKNMARAYVETVLTNELTLDFLEKQK